ncbi:3-galactosyl-N-acetylglucosaminide 4-alpha-L-fucosyltransferase FUT3-like [Montipora capricornis]|uniref:3-galactosyl-N-acetylglucosaminide 4-alpha-L-fucosyltransferase FUT3-like n=1 Tax=Montipora capricornis TaxID=246305 RepID=UPI0035F20744
MASGLDANVTCGEQICKFTHKQRELEVSDAVVFHGRDLPSVSHMKNIEKRKPSKQRWVFYVLESPINTHLHFASLNGLFNWTMTYRIDSDIFLPYGYYTRSRLNPDEISSETTNYADGKDKLAVWISSHCGTLRDKVVRKLLKYIEIDIFGSCARQFNQHEPCRKSSPECTKKLQRYKFYFAFENSFCVDYITEKYWDIPLNQNIVPVVMGGASYENEQLAVPGSFINVANFDSVEALANYLLYLNTNNTAYNEYFWWKKEFKVLSKVWDSWPCRLCHALNNSSLPSKVYNNMDDFWGWAKNCGRNEEKIRKLIAG